MPHDNASLIRVAAQEGSELGVADARVLFAAMLAGEVSPNDLEQILAAWRRRRVSLAELTGFMRALDAHSARMEAPHEGLRPILLPSYHGTRRQANLTALVALLLQRYEIPVLVHGLEREAGSNTASQRRVGEVVSDSDFAAPDGSSGRVTTADVLRELGIEPATSLADAQARLRHDKVAYAPVALLAPGLGRLLARPTRDSLPTFAHSLALLIDPFAGDGYRVIGAPSAADLAALREFLLASRTDALLFLGTEGEPYADPHRQTRLEHVAAGVVTLCADAEDESIEGERSLPAASDAATIAGWIANVLAGALPVPPPLVMQLGCCLAGARRLGAAA